MKARHKIKSLEQLKQIRDAARNQGGKVVFTNGCFDLLHIGHVRYLEEASELGDLLIVAVNTDNSVKQIKGNDRPLLPENERAELVASLHCVDFVTLFDTPDPLSLIEYLLPDFLVKGSDWPVERIIGADAVKLSGGRVASIDLVPDHSTSNLIEKIIERFGRK
ncbi:MAG: D-glycero-beta-D-manno-heptose 1-phosphate adenylyltransferase [Syntrophobacteraceae bacterium]